VIRVQRLRQTIVALGPSAVCEHPSRIGRERARTCPCGKVECIGFLFARPVAELAQRFRRMQPIRTAGISKRGDDLSDPWLALLIAARRLREDAPDAYAVLRLPAVRGQLHLERSG